MAIRVYHARGGVLRVVASKSVRWFVGGGAWCYSECEWRTGYGVTGGKKSHVRWTNQKREPAPGVSIFKHIALYNQLFICDFNREQQQQVLYKVEVQAPFAGGPVVLFDVLNQGGEKGISVRGAKHKKDRRSRGREPEDS